MALYWSNTVPLSCESGKSCITSLTSRLQEIWGNYMILSSLASKTCWHNPPLLFHYLLVENVLWTEFSLLCLESIQCVCLPPHFWKRIPSFMCCCSSSFHSATFFVPSSFWFCNCSVMWKGWLSLSTSMLRSRLGLRKVTFAPPASWGKVNHVPPVSMFNVGGVRVTLLIVSVFFKGTSIILHIALWNPLPGSCWMPRLLLWH